ncbi:MAG: hypothetical protein HY695_16735 [Deltaproteobacteria bacterium]|nr:hypothetical protein [Deltaproteobacteria bacterium]
MGKAANKVDEAVIWEGWETLVEKIGIAKAARFLVAFQRGEGDSVNEIKRFWQGKSLDEIYRMVEREKITPWHSIFYRDPLSASLYFARLRK